LQQKQTNFARVKNKLRTVLGKAIAFAKANLCKAGKFSREKERNSIII